MFFYELTLANINPWLEIIFLLQKFLIEILCENISGVSWALKYHLVNVIDKIEINLTVTTSFSDDAD